MGGTEILVNKGANQVQCETLRLLMPEANFPGNPMKPHLLHQVQEAENQELKRAHKEAGFVFAVATKTKC